MKWNFYLNTKFHVFVSSNEMHSQFSTVNIFLRKFFEPFFYSWKFIFFVAFTATLTKIYAQKISPAMSYLCKSNKGRILKILSYSFIRITRYILLYRIHQWPNLFLLVYSELFSHVVVQYFPNRIKIFENVSLSVFLNE